MSGRSDAGRGRAGRPRKSQRSHDVRLFYRGRWVAADLRPWGLGRPTLREPDSPHWPRGGDRTDSRSVGEEWVGAYLQSVHRIHLRQRVLPRRLKAALEEFARHREGVVEQNTQSTDRTVAGHLLDVFENIPITDAAPRLQELVDRLSQRGYEPSTIRTYVGSAYAFLRWAQLPLPEVHAPAVPETDARFWSDAEIARLRESASYAGDMHRRALELVLACGARQQELFAVRWESLDEASRSIRITEQLHRNSQHTRKPLKGKRARTALVLPSWWAYLDAAVPDWRTRIGLILTAVRGGPVYTHAQRKLLGAVLHGARLAEPGVGWHTGRHTYGRLVLEGGGSLEQLRVFLGHKSIATTDGTYGHLTEQAAIRLARERIFGTG